jgi:hypothetical protein
MMATGLCGNGHGIASDAIIGDLYLDRTEQGVWWSQDIDLRCADEIEIGFLAIYRCAHAVH